MVRFLDAKRSLCPRFYFVSNHDLLAIIAKSKQPQTIIPYLLKIFEGIADISFQANMVVSVTSKRSEFVKLVNPVYLT